MHRKPQLDREDPQIDLATDSFRNSTGLSGPEWIFSPFRPDGARGRKTTDPFDWATARAGTPETPNANAHCRWMIRCPISPPIPPNHVKSIKTRPSYSIRSLAAEAKLASGHLPPVLAGTRHLSTKALLKLLPILGLSPPESAFLENMVKLCASTSQETRIAAISSMKRSAAYQRRNPNEAEFFEYMSRWYNIAIREMSIVPGFQADADWIQARLKVRVPTAELERSLKFLVQHGYLIQTPDGSIAPPKGHLECVGGVHRVALTHYHRQMFDLAAQSIDNSTTAERDLVGHTMVICPEKFDEARAILHEALKRVRSLAVRPSAGAAPRDESVYHFELAMFPLTKKGPV